MLRTLGVVELSADSYPARYCGDALPTRRFAGKPLLEWVVRRMTDALLLEEVVVLAADDSHAEMVRAALPADVSVFALGDNSDSLARFSAVLEAHQADAMVSVSVENPFADPALMDRLIASAESYQLCDYMSYCSVRRQSPMLARLGVHGEWLRAEAVHKANRRAKGTRERANLSRFIRSHPEWFHLRLVPLPKPLDRDDLRLSIGVEQDWEHAEMILDALGPENLEWQQIASLLDDHPDIRVRMEELNQAEAVHPH